MWTTSAPIWASSFPQTGPAITLVMSTTLMSERGSLGMGPSGRGMQQCTASAWTTDLVV